jgi:hypothetical protein
MQTGSEDSRKILKHFTFVHCEQPVEVTDTHSVHPKQTGPSHTNICAKQKM